MGWLLTTYRVSQTFEPPHDKTNKMTVRLAKTGHPPSLIRVFAVRMKEAWGLSYPLSAQQRLGSDWADAQADLRLRWAHSHFVCFVMRRLILSCFVIHHNLFRHVVKHFVLFYNTPQPLQTCSQTFCPVL